MVSAATKMKPRPKHGAASVLVIVPTYNEKENLPKLLDALLGLGMAGLDILVVDDNSPDGTGAIADSYAKKHTAVHVLHRTEKAGLGAAYAAGFRWALKEQYDYVVSMDADFSHNPDDVPRLLAEKETAAIVVGSRYIPGGSIVGWDWRRYANSYGANIATKLLLGLPVRDATAGFKVYTAEFLRSIDLDALIASGYAFQVEMLSLAHQQGLPIAEIPITFVDRRVGESKISGELSRSAKVVLQLAVKRQGVRQFVKFALVGLMNVGVDWSIFFLLDHFSPLPKVGSKFLSFVFGATNSYIFNRRWTFRSTDPEIGRQFVKFILVASIGSLLNTGIYWFVSLKLGYADIVGLAVATGAVMFWNFFANKYWTFRVKE